jgi:Zn-finger in ubiquitin-hydrolases and other protein
MGGASQKEQDVPTCTHLESHPMTRVDFTAECSDCVAIGGRWVHLRRCLTCNHIGCCDSSPNKHASAHAHGSDHPVVTSAEPGEDWRWCYVDRVGA